MLFGATGLIDDSPDYGTKFWNHWTGGDSFSQAWQDALLDVSSGHQPASTAAGSSAADAQNRLFNERFFTNATAPRDWYWWRWVGNAPVVAQAKSVQNFPAKIKFARVAPRLVSRASVLAAMKRLGFSARVTLPDGPLDRLRITAGDARFAILPGGAMVEHMPATPTRSHLTEREILTASDAALGGAAGLGHVAILPAQHAGGRADRGPGDLQPETYEHIVIYRQLVDGLPILTPGTGEARVTVAASGKVRRIVDTRLEIGEPRDSGPSPVTAPAPKGTTTQAPRLTTVDEALAALGRMARHFPGGGDRSSSRLLPDSLTFGYALRGTDLVPAARAKVEIAKGMYRMFEVVEVDLVG